MLSLLDNEVLERLTNNGEAEWERRVSETETQLKEQLECGG